MDKILIIDDSLVQAKMLESILNKEYQTESIHDSHEALQWAERTSPHLILLDIIMPGKSGFDVLCELKNNDRTSNIPVILITSLTDIGNEEKGLRLGAVDYITKPFSEPIVKARIHTHIQLYNYQRAIEQLAMLDALTGLPNRRAYEERVRREWQRCMHSRSPLSIALLDIDYFKQYNDHFGHTAGDWLLKTLSAIFLQHLPQGIGFAARYGGEEFIFLMPETGSEAAKLTCGKIRSHIEGQALPTVLPNGNPSILTVSLGGVTVVPQQYTFYDEFVDAADKMLYQAKKTGKNKVLWAD